MNDIEKIKKIFDETNIPYFVKKDVEYNNEKFGQALILEFVPSSFTGDKLDCAISYLFEDGYYRGYYSQGMIVYKHQ